MKNLRRRIIYTSFHAEADFLAYYDKMGNFVSLVVDMPNQGFNHEEVDKETFWQKESAKAHVLLLERDGKYPQPAYHSGGIPHHSH